MTKPYINRENIYHDGNHIGIIAYWPEDGSWRLSAHPDADHYASRLAAIDRAIERFESDWPDAGVGEHTDRVTYTEA